MADDVTRRLLEIIIRAKSEAGAELRKASAEVTGFQATLATAGKAALTAGTGLGVATTALALGMGALVGQASAFQQTIQTVRGNTVLTTADLNVMHDAVLKLGTQTGASFDQLSMGIMKASNAGYSMADSLLIARQGAMSAVSANANATDTIDTLATSMREFNAPASQAAQYMDELHVAAALGKSSLEAFAQGVSGAHAVAAAIHMPIEQIDAAFVAMTRHGFDVAKSSTYLSGMLEKMQAPAQGAKAELAALGLQTGTNLTADFAHVGQAGYSLVKVITDLRTATASMSDGHRLAASQIRELGQAALAQGMSQKEANAVMKAGANSTTGQIGELFRLIPAMRGGLAAMVLMGAGYKDLTTATENTTAAINGGIIPAIGKAHPTAIAFAEAQKTIANQMARLRNTIQETAITLGEALLPVMQGILDVAAPLIIQFRDWAKAHADMIARVLPLATVLMGVASAVLLVAGTVTLFMAAINPVSAAIVVASALAVAWATNLGGLRPAIEEIAKALIDLGAAFVVWRVGAILVRAYAFANAELGLAILAVRIGLVQQALAAGVARVAMALHAAWALVAAGAMVVVRGATVAWTLATAGLTFALETARGGGILFAAQAVVLAGVAGVVRGATLLWAGAMAVLDLAMDANPLGVLIIAIAAATVAIIWAYNNVGAFHDALNGLWSFISGTLSPALEHLGFLFQVVIGGTIGAAFDALTKLMGLLGHIPGISMPKMDLSSPDMTQQLKKAISEQQDVLKGALGSMGGLGGAGAGLGLGATGTSAGAGAGIWAAGTRPAGSLHLPMAMRDIATQLGATPFVGPVMPTLTPSTTPLSLGTASGASSPVIINVTVAADAVQIRSGGKADSAQKDYGVKVGEAIADALALFARGEQAASPGARTLLPGAR